ncbi:NAD(P)/FAD-dependent oxidoreductase [Pararhodobacter zhoushanensis]|uniref:FAD-binding oxidoreductase n=1 Tax=Pararhodobacter zhoushanensis TaxID=2479545 RepID=A0ABT3GV29_9RHOB|nr:FAD-binding oxidoreductase [Pararhodobacter zhoushanensis]MCW1931370.1 FAD-binding oxidoreductase [Pararhodobacter zhoushanensis]
MAQITVMGAGIFGLTAAWAMARRGASVRVIEAVRVGAGSSGGIVGALAPHVPEQWNAKKAFQFDSLMMAEAFWRDVAQSGGRDPGYARTGRVQPLADEAAVARAVERGQNAQDLWQGLAVWNVVPVGSVPGMRLSSPTGLIIHDTLTARMRPRGAAEALVAALASKGVVVERGAVAPEGRVLWATGVQGLEALGADLGQALGNGVKGQAALFRADFRDAPQLFADALHIIPHADGTVAVGSTSERDYNAPDTTDAQLDDLIARTRALCPDLADAPLLERWAGVRPRSRSRAPMLGEWPGRPGHYVLNGGFKIGFGMAPKLAELAADLLLDGEDGVPDGFRVADSLKRQ